MRKYVLIIIGLFVSILGYSQQPGTSVTFGYMGGQQVLHQSPTDTFSVSFTGGAPFSTQWHNQTEFSTLSGFRHDVLYVGYGFEKDLFVSKGYFSDYVELRWDIARYENQITSFKIFRRVLGSNKDFQFVASVSKTERQWRDEYAESGQLYEYKLLAEGIFPIQQKFLNFVSGVGFRIPYGRVSGRVTYEGGGAVEGVHVFAETDDSFSGKSLQLNGSDAYLAISPPHNHEHFKFEDAFTFEAWVKPESGARSTLMQKGNQYQLTYQTGQLEFTAGGQSLALSFTEKQDTFFHVTAMRTADSLKLILLYDEATHVSESLALSGNASANNDELFIGKGDAGFFNGVIDELRIWHKTFDEATMIRQAGLYIDGTEEGLSAYYRMNEGVGKVFYDLSRQGFSFNEKHGFISKATWSDEVPFSRQLAVKGITDRNGNYIISGIPYSSTGTSYRVIPIFDVHSFDPTEKLVFIGPGSVNHNNFDFIDVASFPVTGTVYYEGTYFPVSGVSIKIDGQLATTPNGDPVTTNSRGEFNVDVPIGRHFLSFEKYGHNFENNGRFPADETELFDFQQAYTFQQPILDQTKIKVIGKVVGGPVQATKPKGLGKSKNNLGNATLVLGTQKEYDLIQTDVETAGVNSSWDNESYQNESLKNKGTTRYEVNKNNPKSITLYPDEETGEFFAYLLPERYVIKSITAGRYTFDPSFHSVVDLTNAFRLSSEIDSVAGEPVISQSGDPIPSYRVDSVQYQHHLDLIFRNKPSVSVTNKEGEIAFWEREINLEDGTTLSLVEADLSPKTSYPIFRQRHSYDLQVHVFEEFVNADRGNEVDRVPVNDGIIEIQNELAIESRRQRFEIDDFGKVNYRFKGGLPNVTTGGIGSYIKSMTLVAYTGKNNAIVTPWTYNNDDFKAYVLGGLPTGNNFVTTGPNKVDMILRDPPGSNSYAYYEEGSSFSRSTSYEVSDGNSGSASLSLLMGVETKTFAGLGAGVIIETEATNNLTIGLEYSETWVNGNTTTSTATNTQTWSTSSDPYYVGANGDVFIGHSTNIVYGTAKFLEFRPNADCTGDCVENVNGYQLGIDVGLRVNPKFGTAFQYSQHHIETNLIPNLEYLRDLYLKGSRYHQSNIPTGSAGYGATNSVVDTVSFTQSMVDIRGDSYNIKLEVPGNWPHVDSIFVDSVAFYNQQILGWKNILAQNEKEKVEAVQDRNLSFDAGVVYEYSQSNENSQETNSSYEWTLAPKIAREFGIEVVGVGFQASLEQKFSEAETSSNGTQTINSTTFGYVLEEEDATDFYSVDVKKPKSQTGPVFQLRGGQSSCPYQGAELTKYFQPGTIIGEATQQIEKPQISIAKSIVTDVPEDKAAIYEVQLGNISETGFDVWYTLSVDHESNQEGAVIKMDGSPINNGRLVFIPGGESVNKVITVEKTKPDVFDYEDIILILHSNCQFDPTDPIPDIADSISLTARFQPVCSKIDIGNLLDQWVVNTNTGTEMNVGLRNYNLANSGFEKVQVQYKPVSSSSWITDMTYYVEETNFIAAPEPKGYLDNNAAMDYIWSLEDLQDRNYDVRLVSFCADGTKNYSDILTGIKDTKRPKVFGTPQPGDGILSPGEDIMLSFDEPIQQGLLLSSNFSVRGVLNGAEIRHNSCLYFDGLDDYITVQAGNNIERKSFTVEFWTRRVDLSPGVIFEKGNMRMGFDQTNKFYWTLGDQILQSIDTYTDTELWMHWAVSYNIESNILSVYMNDQQVITDAPLTGNVNTDGPITVGKSATLNQYYEGYIHDLRVWERGLGFGVVFANMLKTLSGSEVGLSGLWPMDEAKGKFALDKAKNHHAKLHGASWRVFPTGYAKIFNGTRDQLDIPANRVIITPEMDMTLEFWFKGGAQSNTVLFSNGRGDGTDSSPAQEDIWLVGINESGKLYVQNSGYTMTVANELLNEEWQHFALVLNRTSNIASVFINNELKDYEQSHHFGGFSGAHATLGARRFYRSTGTTYDRYFEGSIDELRIWKLARTSKLIDLDMHSKLTGQEKGLLAYYPFDQYDLNLVLRPTLADNDYDDDTEELTGLMAVTNRESFDNQNVPNIKDARPIQNLAFDWVVNEDQVIIALEEPANLIEKTVIEFTVDRIEDLNENRMASPVTWTAYIKQNTVVWDETNMSFEKQLYEELSFEVDIANTGGIEQNFNVDNLPNWLTASKSRGTLAPDSKITIALTVNPDLNIGQYEESIFLTSDFGYNEKLNLSLKVFRNPPEWEVKQEDYQYSMSTIGRLKVDGVFLTNPDDILAAFVGDECRGKANLQYFEEYDLHEVFLNIYSNQQQGEEVTFKIWNASKGTVHEDVTPALTFKYNSVKGAPLQPVIYESNNAQVQMIPLTVGWKWISTSLADPRLERTEMLLGDLGFNTGDLIKGQSSFDVFNESGWRGSLTSAGGLRNEEMYKVKSSEWNELKLKGKEIDASTMPVTLSRNWNWIGFVSQYNMILEDALSNLTATPGDLIKSQFDFAVYDENLGWIGSLKNLIAGEGYMYYSQDEEDKIFAFPNEIFLLPKVKAEIRGNKMPQVPGWNLDASLYQYSNTIIAKVDTSGIDEHFILGAFAKQQCRGIAKPILVNGEYQYFITVYSDGMEALEFKLFDNNIELAYRLNETLELQPDEMTGSVDDPFLLTMGGVETTVRGVDQRIELTPNPTAGQAFCSFHGFNPGEQVQLSVRDVQGRVLFNESVDTSQPIEIDVQEYGAGMYFIKVETSRRIIDKKLILVR